MIRVEGIIERMMIVGIRYKARRIMHGLAMSDSFWLTRG